MRSFSWSGLDVAPAVGLLNVLSDVGSNPSLVLRSVGSVLVGKGYAMADGYCRFDPNRPPVPLW